CPVENSRCSRCRVPWLNGTRPMWNPSAVIVAEGISPPRTCTTKGNPPKDTDGRSERCRESWTREPTQDCAHRRRPTSAATRTAAMTARAISRPRSRRTVSGHDPERVALHGDRHAPAHPQVVAVDLHG